MDKHVADYLELHLHHSVSLGRDVFDGHKQELSDQLHLLRIGRAFTFGPIAAKGT